MDTNFYDTQDFEEDNDIEAYEEMVKEQLQIKKKIRNEYSEEKLNTNKDKIRLKARRKIRRLPLIAKK